MIAKEQLLWTEITIKTNQKFGETNPAHDTKARPNNSESQPVNESHRQLFRIQRLDLTHSGNGKETRETKEKRSVKKHAPSDFPFSGNNPSSLLHDFLI